MRDVFVGLIKSSFNAIMKFLIAFGIGTGAGGILVLGFALALMSDTIFD